MGIISGSDIEINYNPKTGDVNNVIGDNPYNIKKIDIKEYQNHYKVKDMPGNIDILSASIWASTASKSKVNTGRIFAPLINAANQPAL